MESADTQTIGVHHSRAPWPGSSLTRSRAILPWQSQRPDADTVSLVARATPG